VVPVSSRFIVGGNIYNMNYTNLIVPSVNKLTPKQNDYIQKSVTEINK